MESSRPLSWCLLVKIWVLVIQKNTNLPSISVSVAIASEVIRK